MSPDIIEEYFRVSRELADQFPGIEINPLLTLIIAHSEIIQSLALDQQLCQDPDDDKFLNCAISSDTNTITDDTVLTIAVADCILHRGALKPRRYGLPVKFLPIVFTWC
jgi:putative PIN family toxin of toxin-antitoxin system